jgi:hypothetical protein
MDSLLGSAPNARAAVPSRVERAFSLFERRNAVG